MVIENACHCGQLLKTFCARLDTRVPAPPSQENAYPPAMYQQQQLADIPQQQQLQLQQQQLLQQQQQQLQQQIQYQIQQQLQLQKQLQDAYQLTGPSSENRMSPLSNSVNAIS